MVSSETLPTAVSSSCSFSSCSSPVLTVTLLAAGKSLVCTVWPHKAHNFPNLPQRLGIVHCLNRPCSLYSITIPFTCKNNTPSDNSPQAQCLTEGLLSAMSPKFSPSGDRLVFLSHDAAASSGVHSATAALKSIHWSSGDCCILLQHTVKLAQETAFKSYCSGETLAKALQCALCCTAECNAGLGNGCENTVSRYVITCSCSTAPRRSTVA